MTLHPISPHQPILLNSGANPLDLPTVSRQLDFVCNIPAAPLSVPTMQPGSTVDAPGPSSSDEGFERAVRALEAKIDNFSPPDSEPRAGQNLRKVNNILAASDAPGSSSLHGPLTYPGSPHQRMHALFPTLTRDAQRAVVYRPNVTLVDSLERLENGLRELANNLDIWEGEAQSQGQRDARQEVSRRLIAAWRREELTSGSVYDSRRLGLGLDLSGLPSGALPALGTGFSHLQWLDLGNMGLNAQQLAGFLPRLQGLVRLDLSANQLTQLPSGLQEMRNLNNLDLSTNQLQWHQGLFEPLNGMPLTRLGLSGNPLALSGEGIEALAQLQSLRQVDMRSAGLELNDADWRQLALIEWGTLDLRDNRIVLSEAGAAAFSPMTRMSRLLLANNPLGRSPQMASMSGLRFLDLTNTGLTEWPEGLTELMRLREVHLRRNPIVEIPSLAGSAFAHAARLQLPLTLQIDDSALSEQSRSHLRQINVAPMSGNGQGGGRA